MWRPQLKFTGQYGKTDSWSEFTSLKRQIDKALKKEPPYEEDEVCEAALRTVTAGTELRTFLDGVPELTLDLLIETLRSYYSEPEEKDLLNDLNKLRQGHHEDAQVFVMRGINLVHQFSSKKKTRMNEEMAFEILLDSLETGFENDTVRSHMRPYLKDPTASESTLLDAIKRVKKTEKDRKDKFPKGPTARMNEVSVDDGLLASLVAKVEVLDVNVDEIKQYIGTKDTNSDDKGNKKIIYGCKDCKSKGQSNRCTHCFRCGKDTHKSFECPEKDKQSNQIRSPLRT